MTDRWLIDKSAFARLDESPDFDLWVNRLNRGLLYASTVTILEIGLSARNGPEWQRLVEEPPAAKLIVEYLTPAAEDRALDVQQQLAERGQNRAPSIPDLLIAATAELFSMTVLHVDKDFDLIGGITGQPMERLLGTW